MTTRGAADGPMSGPGMAGSGRTMTSRMLVATLVALLAACSRSSLRAPAATFAIYTLQDTTLTVADAATRDLDGLVLEPTPFLTGADLTTYSWSDHSFSVTPAMRSRLETLGAKPYKSAGIPFVVLVGDERLYLGAFWYGYSSSWPRVPYVVLPPVGSLKLHVPAIGEVADPRSDERLRASLKRAGLLVD